MSNEKRTVLSQLQPGTVLSREKAHNIRDDDARKAVVEQHARMIRRADIIAAPDRLCVPL